MCNAINFNNSMEVYYMHTYKDIYKYIKMDSYDHFRTFVKISRRNTYIHAYIGHTSCMYNIATCAFIQLRVHLCRVNNFLNQSTIHTFISSLSQTIFCTQFSLIHFFRMPSLASSAIYALYEIHKCEYSIQET